MSRECNRFYAIETMLAPKIEIKFGSARTVERLQAGGGPYSICVVERTTQPFVDVWVGFPQVPGRFV